MSAMNNHPELLSLLQPQPGERILDLGCGNGTLTSAIAAAGAIPTGIEVSAEMVNRARQNHPELDLQVADARHYRTARPFDAVFSHAVIHWIKDAPAVAETVFLALRQGGRFVTEFAGHGNVATLTTAIEQELTARGYAWAGRNPWYHPTIGEYASLLERTGFRVTFAQHFDRPTPLKAEGGIRRWLESFADHFFADVSAEERLSIYDAIEERVRPHLYRDGQWVLDTSRLRIRAVKGAQPSSNC